jgi:hypothetical protein
MAPRNQTKKVRPVEERYLLADFNEEIKAIKKQKKEDKHKAVIDERIARREAKRDKLANPEPKPEPVHEPKPEPQSDPVPEPDVIVID